VSRLVARWLALPPNLRGILWVGLSGVVFALLNVFTLIPSQHLNPYVMAFLRYLFGAMFLLPLVIRLGPYRSLHTNRMGLHISRGAIHTVGMMLWFVALPLTTLAEITALGFTGPIFVTLGAVLFLRETVHWRRWAAVGIGFFGMLVIVRPGLVAMNPGIVMMMIAVPLIAGSNLIAKVVSGRDRPEVVVLWQSVVGAVCFAPFGLWFWQTPTGEQLLWFLASGFFGTMGYFFITWAYRLLDISALQPITFLGIVWAALSDVALWGKTSDGWTFVGAAIIVAATSYIAHREARAGGKKT
jgi:drug/metabolite transporter (DMT)-like permease